MVPAVDWSKHMKISSNLATVTALMAIGTSTCFAQLGAIGGAVNGTLGGSLNGALGSPGGLGGSAGMLGGSFDVSHSLDAAGSFDAPVRVDHLTRGAAT